MAGMNTVTAAIKACGDGAGVIKLKVEIAATGDVVQAEALEAYAGTKIGNCAIEAIMKATFPATEEKTFVTYPFKF